VNILDASVVTDALAVKGPAGERARRLVAAKTRLHVPAILTAEVASALRAMLRRGDLRAPEARAAALRASAIRARRYPFEPFVARVWELRDNVTVYDAWYVALAETLDASLVSADDRLRRSDGPRCPSSAPPKPSRPPDPRGRSAHTCAGVASGRGTCGREEQARGAEAWARSVKRVVVGLRCHRQRVDRTGEVVEQECAQRGRQGTSRSRLGSLARRRAALTLLGSNPCYRLGQMKRGCVSRARVGSRVPAS